MKVSATFVTLLTHTYASPSSPLATGAQDDELSGQGYTPRPTNHPHFDLHERNLHARSLTVGQLLGYVAPDETIGFLAGNGLSPYTCRALGATAVIADGAFGCCVGADCAFPAVCYNYAATRACDHDCQAALDVVLCTSSAFPYCYGYSVADMSATGYDCESAAPTRGFGIIYTTYSDENDGRSAWSPLTYEETSNSAVATAIGAAKSSSKTTTATPTTSAVHHKSTPVGAIVGGIVGGLAALATLVGVLVYMCLRKRKSKNTPEGTHQPSHQPQPQQQQQQQYPSSGQQHQHHYSPLLQQQQQYPQQTPISYIPSPEQQSPTTYLAKEPLAGSVSPQSPAPPYGQHNEQNPHSQGMSELPTSSYIPTHSKEGTNVYEAEG